MRRTFAVFIGAGLLAGAGGCSIAGSWRVVTIDPPEAAFPVSVVTFDRNNGYTATGRENGQGKTSTGEYRYNGFSLDILQNGRLPSTYRARLGLNGELILIHGKKNLKVSATLVRVE